MEQIENISELLPSDEINEFIFEYLFPSDEIDKLIYKIKNDLPLSSLDLILLERIEILQKISDLRGVKI